MDKLVGVTGNAAAIAGTLVCALAGAARLFGYHDIVGLDALSLFTVGTGAMVFACLTKLHVLVRQTKPGESPGV